MKNEIRRKVKKQRTPRRDALLARVLEQMVRDQNEKTPRTLLWDSSLGQQISSATIQILGRNATSRMLLGYLLVLE